MSATMTLIVRHEWALLKRNSLAWFRFGVFYIVFAAFLTRDILRQPGERLTLIAVGLMVLAAVGMANTLGADAFAHEKDRGTMEAVLLAPTTARVLAAAKIVFVFSGAMAGVIISFLTGPIVAIATNRPDALSLLFNRTTTLVCLVVAPTAALWMASVGSWISSRSRSLQASTTASALCGIAGLAPAMTVALAVMESTSTWTLIVLSLAVGLAFVAFRVVISSVRPETVKPVSDAS